MVPSELRQSRRATINNELGLHARSAAMVAALAQNARGSVWIEKNRQRADASSILDILTLACEKGAEVNIIIEDPADSDILNAIAGLVASGFGEQK